MQNYLILLIVSLTLAACGGGDGSVNGRPLTSTGMPAPVLLESPKSLDLLIFGGTSGIGLATTQLALARGHRVTSITRRPERMPIQHANLTNLKGDITDRSSFNVLLDGKHAVISAIGLKPGRKEVHVYSKGMENVLAAMREFNVGRVVSVTGIGAGDSHGHGGFFYDRILQPFLLKFDYADKTRQEAILKASQSQWTIVRPGFLTDADMAVAYRVIQDMQGVVSGDIARADVAHFILAAVEQENYLRNVVFLSN